MTEYIFGYPENFYDLILGDSPDILECPGCSGWNAYAWQDSNMQPNTPHERFYYCGIDGVERNSWPDVYHIPSGSGFEWTCGKCGTSWMERDSPLAAECYTHVDYSEMEE